MTTARNMLPEGVRLVRDGLIDDVRHGTVALNSSATVLLDAALAEDRDLRLAHVSSQTGVEILRLHTDLETLVARLNRLGFVNFARGTSTSSAYEWLRTVIGGLRAGIPPGAGGPLPNHRTAAGGGLRGAARGLAPMRGVLLRVMALMLVATVAVAFATGGDLTVALAFVVAASVGVALHELAHLTALGTGPAAVLTSTLGVRILHPPLTPRRRRKEVVAGPLVPTVVGLTLIMAAGPIGGQAAVAAGIPLVAHALNLLCVAGDGSALLAGLRRRRLAALGIGVGVGAVLAAAGAQAVDLSADLLVIAVAALIVGAGNALGPRVKEAGMPGIES